MNHLIFHALSLWVRIAIRTGALVLIFGYSLAAAGAATFHVATTGNDANPGTESEPFLTVQKGVDVAQAGDIVLVAAGRFVETMLSKRNGSEEKPITLRGTTGSEINIISLSHSWIIVENMRVTRGCTFKLTSSNCTIQDCELNPIDGIGKNNITMDPGDKGKRPHSHRIRRNKLLNAKGLGVGVSLHGRNHIVENNYYSSQNGADANWIFANDCTIRGNTFQNWSNPGIPELHSDLFQAFGNNNDVAENLVIEGNVAIDCKNCQLGNVTDDKFNNKIANWTWRNNIWIRVSGPLNLFSSGHKFYNNTWVQSPITHSSGVVIRTSTDRGNGHDAKFFNNIFYKCGQTPANANHGFWGFVAAAGVPITGFEADYNLVIGSGAGTTKGDGWTKFNSNTHGLNGVDPLLVEPMDPTTADHVRLRQGSPAIGAGKNLSEFFTTDFSGRQRLNRWDIGAHQSGGALSAPTGYRELKAP